MPPSRKRARAESDGGEAGARKQSSNTKEERTQQQQHHPSPTPPPPASPEPDAANDGGSIDALLERTMRDIVSARVYPSTACPSEVPRRLVAEEEAARRRRGGGGGARLIGSDWRALMEPTREVARRLAREGVLQITQRGQAVLDLDAPLRGPIRLRPMPPAAAR